MKKSLLVIICFLFVVTGNSFCQVSATTPQNVAIGDLYTFDDGTCGIVFYINGEHGLVVSMKSAKMKWSTGKFARKDIPDVPNICEALPIVLECGEGAKYSKPIYDITQSPAVEWCYSLGDGWYLPSGNELCYLLSTANARSVHSGPISKALKKNGGTSLQKGWYWSSTECNKKDAVNIDDDGGVATEEKKEKNLVRAVRAF